MKNSDITQNQVDQVTVAADGLGQLERESAKRERYLAKIKFFLASGGLDSRAPKRLEPNRL